MQKYPSVIESSWNNAFTLMSEYPKKAINMLKRPKIKRIQQFSNSAEEQTRSNWYGETDST